MASGVELHGVEELRSWVVVMWTMISNYETSKDFVCVHLVPKTRAHQCNKPATRASLVLRRVSADSTTAPFRAVWRRQVRERKTAQPKLTKREASRYSTRTGQRDQQLVAP